MRKLMHIVAWFLGDTDCPACGSILREHEAGYSVCDCGVAVDYERGSWSYAGNLQRRPLPGVFGLNWEDAA